MWGYPVLLFLEYTVSPESRCDSTQLRCSCQVLGPCCWGPMRTRWTQRFEEWWNNSSLAPPGTSFSDVTGKSNRDLATLVWFDLDKHFYLFMVHRCWWSDGPEAAGIPSKATGKNHWSQSLGWRTNMKELLKLTLAREWAQRHNTCNCIWDGLSWAITSTLTPAVTNAATVALSQHMLTRPSVPSWSWIIQFKELFHIFIATPEWWFFLLLGNDTNVSWLGFNHPWNLGSVALKLEVGWSWHHNQGLPANSNEFATRVFHRASACLIEKE